MKWRVHIWWKDNDYPVGPLYNTRDDAEWAIAEWKTDMDCRRDHAFSTYSVVPENHLDSDQGDGIDLAQLERDSRPKGE